MPVLKQNKLDGKRTRKVKAGGGDEGDSSDEDDEGDSSDEDDAPKKRPAKKPRTKKPPAKKPLAAGQTTIKMKVRPMEITDKDHELVKLAPVEPPISAENAASRFVLRGDFYPDLNVIAFIAKVMKVTTVRGKKCAQIKFADNKTVLFELAKVIADFKPVSAPVQ